MTFRHPEVFEPPDALRARFNRGNDRGAAERQQYDCCLLADAKAGPADLPVGTRSVGAVCTNNRGYWVFVVHYYLVPDKQGGYRVGNSGEIDPKFLFEDGVVFKPLKVEPAS